MSSGGKFEMNSDERSKKMFGFGNVVRTRGCGRFVAGSYTVKVEAERSSDDESVRGENDFERTSVSYRSFEMRKSRESFEHFDSNLRRNFVEIVHAEHNLGPGVTSKKNVAKKTVENSRNADSQTKRPRATMSDVNFEHGGDVGNFSKNFVMKSTLFRSPFFVFFGTRFGSRATSTSSLSAGDAAVAEHGNEQYRGGGEFDRSQVESGDYADGALRFRFDGSRRGQEPNDDEIQQQENGEEFDQGNQNEFQEYGTVSRIIGGADAQHVRQSPRAIFFVDG